jgi:hypothetical protein
MLRVLRAARGSFQNGACWRLLLLIVHRAMVHAVTAAASGQRRIFVRRKGKRERPSSEEEHQEDGKGTPHPWTMLHDLGITGDSGKDVVFRYHRCIRIPVRLTEGFDAVTCENLCLGEIFRR